MSLPQTETRPSHTALDEIEAMDAVRTMVDSQKAAIESAKQAAANLLRGAEVMANAIRADGNLIYAAAGSSGLMALADACELNGTFGIPQTQIQMHMSGGVPVDADMPGHTEDEVADIPFTKRDVAIVASASGTTPYAVAVGEQARAAGATVISIANNANTPLLHLADVPILLTTPPEVVAGSTRLGAGSAQKTALNILSTMMGVKLGHVYKGLMVNLVADNEKLRQRALNIVRDVTGVSGQTAQSALQDAQGCVKTAIVIAFGHSRGQAIELLELNDGHLGPCLNPTL